MLMAHDDIVTLPAKERPILDLLASVGPMYGLQLVTIFTVLRRLGLELKQQEATVPVHIVEHIERPAGE
jgi:hypothetical protein